LLNFIFLVSIPSEISQLLLHTFFVQSLSSVPHTIWTFLSVLFSVIVLSFCYPTLIFVLYFYHCFFDVMITYFHISYFKGFMRLPISREYSI
jgi:hypothetical protein